MNTENIIFLPAHKIREMVINRELSPLEIVHACLERISGLNSKLNAILSYNSDLAIAEAERVSQLLANGDTDQYPLLGVPVVIFDRIKVKGLPFTMGSLLFKDNIADHDSLDVIRLKKAGAMVIGKTNCSEFSFSPHTVNKLMDPCHNPWDVKTETGGGEGGAAASVAAGFSSAAIALDGAGSLRLPSGFCGTFGIKPTRGLVPIVRDYEVVFAKRLFSQVGPVTRSVRDAAMFLNVLAHYDCRDIQCVVHNGDSYEDTFKEKTKTFRIGWSEDLGFITPNDQAIASLHRVVAKLKDLGHHVQEVKLQLTDDVVMHMGNILFADTYVPIVSLIGDDSEKYSLLTDETKRWLDRGKHVTGIAFSVGLTYMNWLQQHINDLFENIDLLLTPISPCIPDKMHCHTMDPILGMWSYLLPFNMSGHPAATIPCGKTEHGLPMSVQIVGRYFEEKNIFRLAHDIEKSMPWNYSDVNL